MGLGKPRAVEFFASIDLVRLALERQGWDVVFANDIDEDKAQMYRDNWPGDNHLVVGDIHDLKPGDIPDCDLFIALSPATISPSPAAGKASAAKNPPPSGASSTSSTASKSRKPPLILLENVLGFLTRNGGSEALLALNKRGYNVDAFILNAAFWAPQSRARLFVVAKLGDSNSRQTLARETDTRPEAPFNFINASQMRTIAA